MNKLYLQIVLITASLLPLPARCSMQTDWGICTPQEQADYRLRLQEKIQNILPISCDISFLVADIKYTDGQLKICEFGEGNESRFEGHDFMYGKGTIWSRFWEYVKPFSMPIWYLGPKLYDVPRGHDYSDTQEICYPDFLAAKGRHIVSLDQLGKDHLYQQLIKQQCLPTNDLAQAKGLFILRHRDSSTKSFQPIRELNKRFLIMDSATAPFINNKYFTNILFGDDPELAPFKPKYVLCRKKYNKNLAQLIQQTMPCERYVIKPLEEFKGRGVIIVDPQDLDRTLYKILYINGVLKHGQKAHKKYESTGHWKRDRSPYFLVEQYCPSKTVMVDGKPHDPTMRVAFVLMYNKNEIKIHYLGAYWKIPLFSLEDNVKLTKKHKSWGLRPAAVPEQDLENVYKLLDQCLPRLYTKMIECVNSSK